MKPTSIKCLKSCWRLLRRRGQRDSVVFWQLQVLGIETETFSGSCEGVINPDRQGTNGFGYDPIFYLPEKERTMAELSPEEKSAISHRGAALSKLKAKFPQYINNEDDHK